MPSLPAIEATARAELSRAIDEFQRAAREAATPEQKTEALACAVMLSDAFEQYLRGVEALGCVGERPL